MENELYNFCLGQMLNRRFERVGQPLGAKAQRHGGLCPLLSVLPRVNRQAEACTQRILERLLSRKAVERVNGKGQ